MLENESVCTQVADKLAELRDKYTELNILFKGSFDKANRSSLTSERGLGIDEGLALLAKIKERYGFRVTTDIHLPEQAAKVAEVCDALQIPAFLCRQTDLLVAAAKTGKAVNVKKGQFLSPQEMRYVVDKLEGSNAAEIWQTDRGTFFGYQNLVSDMRCFQMMKEHGHPTIYDATHSVQLPGAGAGHSSGAREFVPSLTLAAIAAGADGLFIETHPEPAKALSDAAVQLPLESLEPLLKKAISIWKITRELV